MIASDLKILSIPKNDNISCKSDNNSPITKYQKQSNVSQKYQNNNATHHHNNNASNRKKIQKIPTSNSNNNNLSNVNKNHNGQSYATNNRKKYNNQFNNTCTPKTNSSNNSNIIKNQNLNQNQNANTHNPISTSNARHANIVINNNNNTKNISSDENLVPKSRCDTVVSKNIASDLISASTNKKPAASSNSLVSSSSSLSSSLSSSPSLTSTNIYTNSSINNKGRVPIRFGTGSNNNRKKSQPTVEDINNKKSPNITNMVVSTSGVSNSFTSFQQQPPPPPIFTAPVCTTTSAPSSAPASPSSYSLDFLHSVGVQMTGGIDPGPMANNQVYNNSGTASPARNTHNMLIQGQRIIYQDIPPPEKRTQPLDRNQQKYSPKVHSPSYKSYDIPILSNNSNHPRGDCYASPYNYPPLNNNNYKRNNYIPVSYPYQKSQNESYTNGTNTPTYNRNRNNQSKAWNTGTANGQKNVSNGMPKHNSDYANSQLTRVKSHQNINNLTYVTTDPNNNNKHSGENNRSQSSSPQSDNPANVPYKATTKSDYRPPVNTATSPSQFPALEKSDSVDVKHCRVASEGYESDCSSSSSGKKTHTRHNNLLSSSLSSLSSAEIVNANQPPSKPNMAHMIPILHAQFLLSAYGPRPSHENFIDFQQHNKKSQGYRNSYRGGRGRHFIHNNINNIRWVRVNDLMYSPADRFISKSHIVFMKDPPRALLNRSKWDNLSQGIWNKFVNAQQSDCTFRRKMKLWRQLYLIVKETYPRLGLYLVGSTMSGFGADTSDIDMCLVSKTMPSIDTRMEALYNLSYLKEYLSKQGGFIDFNVIGAKVPILRFKDTKYNLEVDLNYNNCVGIRNTHLLFCYSQLDWRLRPLVLVTKLWAQYHNINNAKTMTISSYSLVLMVIHFLQCAVNPPVLPCLHEMYPEKFTFIQRSNDFGHVDIAEKIAPYDSQNSQSVGQLFLQFLQYYSHFNYSQFAISIRTGAVIPIEYCRHAKSWKNDIHQWKELCIEEPFDLTNTARSVYDFETFERVKLVFITSFRVLQQTLDINSIFSPLVPVWSVPEN